MDSLLKNFHYLLILWALLSAFLLYEEQEENFENLKQQVPAMTQEVARLQTRLGEVEIFKQNLEASKERVKAVVNQVEMAQKQLPSDSNPTDIQEIITAFARDVRIKDSTVKYDLEINKGFYFSKTFNFSAEGTYLQGLIFLERLGGAERILNITDLKLKKSKSQARSRYQLLDMRVGIESYQYNPEVAEKKEE